MWDENGSRGGGRRGKRCDEGGGKYGCAVVKGRGQRQIYLFTLLMEMENIMELQKEIL